MLLRRREKGVLCCVGACMHVFILEHVRMIHTMTEQPLCWPRHRFTHKWLLCASVNLGAETAGHDEQGPIQREMSKTGEEEEEKRGETAMGSLAKSAGSIHSHLEFNILMCSWNRKSNKERDGEGGREGKRVALFNNENWAEISQAARERERERPTINYQVRK